MVFDGKNEMLAAGILRDVAYDTKGTKNTEPKCSQTGWGVKLSGSINTVGKDKVLQHRASYATGARANRT